MFGSYQAVLLSSFYFEVWLFQPLVQVQRNSTRINLNCQPFHSIKWLLGSRDSVLLITLFTFLSTKAIHFLSPHVLHGPFMASLAIEIFLGNLIIQVIASPSKNIFPLLITTLLLTKHSVGHCTYFETQCNYPSPLGSFLSRVYFISISSLFEFRKFRFHRLGRDN